MANFVYNNVAGKIVDQSINLLTDILKVMLVTSAYVPDRDHDFVSSAAAAELATTTNYVPGFGGAGRKLLAGRTVTVDDPNDRSELDCNDFLWTALGGASNQTIAAFIVIKEITNDAASLLIAYVDTSTGTPSLPFTTNGSDFTGVINVEGLIQLSTVP